MAGYFLLFPDFFITNISHFSRQFGFLRLTQPENQSQNSLVQKAIKHLQRLLIQSQKQKERRLDNLTSSSGNGNDGDKNTDGPTASSTTSSVCSSATLTAKSSPVKDGNTVGTTTGSSTTDGGFIPINEEDSKLNVNIKDELDLGDLDDKFLNDFTADGEKIGTDIKLEIEDIEMDDLNAQTSSSDSVKLENDKENEIHIDPKSYCKLGHFHLLLEEYEKGW